ncbi:hypothetical protein CANMA_001196 [Candida margitis]|uniref:uncharacterized protein n=1 Tax=Candida margitis TaxID=1775924 RepID=UPI002225CB81|nr:uncharacterized protein CANMA_001196 [Candida margitis]KAI5969734.1 hypothetical protein CANMA_001196 [Candida margitis]
MASYQVSMNNGICQNPGPVPRLPSFRQLNETLKDIEFVSPTQRVVQHPSSIRNSALFEDSQPAPQNSSIDTSSNGRSFGKGQEYMYGTPIYGRHESYPNQYYTSKNEVSLPSYSTSPSSIESLDISKTEQDRGQPHKENDYKFVSELIKFFTYFESKCKEINVLSYYTYENTGHTFENVLQRMKSAEIDQVLNNLRKVSGLLEDVKRHKDKKQLLMGSKVAKAQSGNSASAGIKRGLSQHMLNSCAQKKNRRKNLKMEPFLSGGNLLPGNVSTDPNDACLYFERKNQFEESRVGPDSTLKPEVVCQHCHSKETPEWRRGPEGSRTLCNACGLFYSKLIKKYGLHEADKIMLERKQTGAVNDRRIF